MAWLARVAMHCRGRAQKVWLCLCFSLILSCNLPFLPAPPLTIAAARQALDRWNPQYCKVVEFYGFYQAGAGDTKEGYVLLANPKEHTAKPVIFVAQFKLLTLPDDSQEWFLTSLVSHSGGLTRRQGWDNLLIPVKEKPLNKTE
jgi:hypothetical protein